MKPEREAPLPPSAALAIPSDPAEARRVQERIEQLLYSHHVNDRDVFSIKLALEEALINAIKHGNQMDRAKRVHVTYRLLPGRFEVAVTDEGPGFDPGAVPDCTAPENLERPSGRGLMLMRHYMTQVAYNDRGNGVIMHKVFHSNGRAKK
jgi:serine/threonine-protein kinase RsbW